MRLLSISPCAFAERTRGGPADPEGRAEDEVLVLTMYDSDPLIQQVLQAGARGYLLKSDAGRDLVSAIDALRRNKTFFTPKVSQMVLEGYRTKTQGKG